ncbi:hypothetical protein QWZ08_04435 [Ferruginibacter paludis]|uniref:hypothetical protein n=1 Tax=Ferruginibacter paludis TaxID=1310417 RepID=UPI0025B52C67|nr:hypothetical protein [Ferruginibacter paludis]MDN3654863.1 hypothetical protein [Ferruginibacter paludis]
MRGSNLRILIFIDLLATALGSSIILMMVLSVNKGKAIAKQAGIPREFIHYRVSSPDTGAHFNIIVKSGETSQWVESQSSIGAITDTNFFLKNADKSGEKKVGKLLIWGPVTEYSDQGKTPNQFNVFSTIQKGGPWIIGVLYYDNSGIKNDDSFNINDSIEVIHSWRLPHMLSDTVVHKWVTLGNYSTINFKIDVPESQ